MQLPMLLAGIAILILANSANASACTCSDHTEVNGSGRTIGNCLSTFQGSKWCYVSSGSSCPDKKQSSRNDQLYWSVSACQQNTDGESSISGCKTVGGDDTGSSCVFPFIYHDRSYSECTLKNSDEGVPWCSTKVDREGVHVGGEGKWGHCGQECPVESESDSVITTTEDPNFVPEGFNDFQRGLVLKRGFWSNEWDKPLSFECPSGQAISSMMGYHSNQREDRLFHFDCQPTTYIASTCKWTGYLNGFDQPIDFMCNGNDQGVLVGLKSYHSNREEDRRWDMKCCSTGPLSCSWTDYINEWDGWMYHVVPAGSRIAGMQSQHDNGREDRRWKLRICKN